jgi:hypothetical protein
MTKYLLYKSAVQMRSTKEATNARQIMTALAEWNNFYVIVGIREALFGVGAAALLLLFVAIHNAWDGVAYLLFVMKLYEPRS